MGKYKASGPAPTLNKSRSASGNKPKAKQIGPAQSYAKTPPSGKAFSTAQPSGFAAKLPRGCK